MLWLFLFPSFYLKRNVIVLVSQKGVRITKISESPELAVKVEIWKQAHSMVNQEEEVDDMYNSG